MFVGFLGTHERSLDDKGRLALPVPFRSHLGDTCFATRAPGAACLGVWTAEDFQRTLGRLRERVRNGEASTNQLRRFAAGAAELRQDSQGRVVLPSHLRDAVGLDREVMVIGAGDRVEVWDPQRWTEVHDAAEDAADDGNWM
ncbi:MAG: cell division/cell wall cluster transcriptional repressor MraZ [Acidimicrobiales bacterium]